VAGVHHGRLRLGVHRFSSLRSMGGKVECRVSLDGKGGLRWLPGVRFGEVVVILLLSGIHSSRSWPGGVVVNRRRIWRKCRRGRSKARMRQRIRAALSSQERVKIV
jgi:hypothetical protein